MGNSNSQVADDERVQQLVQEAVQLELDRRERERDEREREQQAVEERKREEEENALEVHRDDRFVSLSRNSAIIEAPFRYVFSPFATPNSGTHTWEFDMIRDDIYDRGCRSIPAISLVTEAKAIDYLGAVNGDGKKEEADDDQTEEWVWSDQDYCYYHRKEPLTVGRAAKMQKSDRVKVVLHHIDKDEKLFEIFIDGELVGGMDNCHKWQQTKNDSIGKVLYLTVKKQSKFAIRFVRYEFVANSD